MEINEELEMLGRAAFVAIQTSGADLDGARTWRDYFRPMVDNPNNPKGLDFYADHISDEIQEIIASQDEEINRLEDEVTRLENEVTRLEDEVTRLEDEVTRLEDILEENGIEH